MKYKPKPIDTSHIELTKEIIEVTETLAESAHDNWAQQRITEGWSYGPERDDGSKKHPCLVPYEDLPESEKEYDRNVAIETLKSLLSLGYKIEPPEILHKVPVNEYYEDESLYIDRLKNQERLSLSELMKMWRMRSGLGKGNSLTFYQLLGERILRVGEPLLAYDVLNEGLQMENWPNDVRLRQLLALALARIGATRTASKILKGLKDQGYEDGETLGLLARTYKDLWERSSNLSVRNTKLKEAKKHYSDAFHHAEKTGHLDDGLYNGINAASTAMLLGSKEEAKSLARKVQGLCHRLKIGIDYWALATLAEAAIILGDFGEAESRYLEAAETGKGHLADLSSTRHQARLLLSHLGMDRHQMDHCFRIPRVVVFAGHMIDQPGRPVPRFPESMEKAVYREIASTLQKMDAGIGYSSAAMGSDILFLEAMLERKCEINVILPYEREVFKKNSVDIIPDTDWGKRFEKVLNEATRIVIAGEHCNVANPIIYEYTNLLLDGLSVLRGQMLETEVYPLMLWDGRPGDGIGGTSSIARHWRYQDRKLEIIDINRLLQETLKLQNGLKSPESMEQRSHEFERYQPLPQEIRALLFLDVQGYTRLTEEQIPTFVEHFMGTVGQVLDEFPVKPLYKNTWGDALYSVFSSVKDAGNFALQLRDRICGNVWEESGLPEDLNLRLSLHAGPVFPIKDPVLGTLNYSGFHVSRAARIEPITPPGEVYASQHFAALAAAEGVSDFTCEYVGQVPLPKKSGIIPLYLVRRTDFFHTI